MGEETQSRRRTDDVPSSPVLCDVEYLVIGRIVAPRGVRGELKVQIETDDPARFLDLKRVFVGEARRPYEVEAARLFKNQALLTLRGVADRDAAEALRGEYVYVHRENALPLADGEYYYHQIQGLRVVTEEGRVLGEVVEVLATGANDVYVVQGDSGEALIPAIRDVVLRIDLSAGLMTVRLLEGLI